MDDYWAAYRLIGPFEELTKELSAADISITMMMLLIATLEKNLSDPDVADENIGDTINETVAF